MESWLTFADYQAQHPDASLTEAQFELLARDAALFIENATRWCASLAQTDGEKALLSTCQAQLVELARRRRDRMGRRDQREQSRVHRKLCLRHGRPALPRAAAAHHRAADPQRPGHPLDALCGQRRQPTTPPQVGGVICALLSMLVEHPADTHGAQWVPPPTATPSSSRE